MKNLRMVFIPLFFLLIFIHTSLAQIHLSGSIRGMLQGTVYQVDDSIYVLPQDSLWIESGATFLFMGTFDFSIYGYIEATGTTGFPIEFRHNSSSGRWGGIRFYDSSSDSSVLEHCKIHRSNFAGIRCYHANPTLRYCEIYDNLGSGDGGGLNLDASSPILEYCNIHNNSGTDGAGMFIYNHSSPQISHCTISNHSSSQGGGIYCGDYSDPILAYTTFDSNIATQMGGGMYVYFVCNVTLRNCTFTDNHAGYNGAGFYVSGSSSAIIDSCIFDSNTTSESGAGIYISTRIESSISHCDIFNNTAYYGGGGIALDYYSTVAISFCSIHNNHARGGGGISGTSYTATVSYCTINGNTASEDGGGVSGSLNFDHTLITNNSSQGNGGGVFGNSVLTNCTISRNSAVGEGGGIFYEEYNVISLMNSIIEGNTNGGICGYNLIVPSVSYCDFHNNQGGNFIGNPPEWFARRAGVNANGDSCDIYKNIFLNPSFINPDSGNFNLRRISPCIDAGNPESPLDPDSSITDIGAFYYYHLMENSELVKFINSSDFKLLPNYPNPFNSNTTICYYLPIASKVRCDIYDVLGKRISIVCDKWMEPGPHFIVWNAQFLPSGIYFCQLKAADFCSVRKLILLK